MKSLNDDAPTGTTASARRRPPHRKIRRRRRRCAIASLAASALVRNNNGGIGFADASPNNFCGLDWGDASGNCEYRQPCPMGTDEECTANPWHICWGDTTCDANAGDGVMFNKGHPQHQRFCGSSWTDAATNCEASRHCPSGKDDECPGEETCVSFLSGCNYSEMVDLQALALEHEAMQSEKRLPERDPTRTNWCGFSWGDASEKCDTVERWCPTGTNDNCSGGETCFGGTECTYMEDLVPTFRPTQKPTPGPTTPAPTDPPTPSPVAYHAPAHSRFCGIGWTDAQHTCRIDSYCPSGSNLDCPIGQDCVSSLAGCNILDMYRAREDTGRDIYGYGKWRLDDSVVFENGSPPGPGPSSTSTPEPTPEPKPSPLAGREVSNGPPSPTQPTRQIPVPGTPVAAAKPIYWATELTDSPVALPPTPAGTTAVGGVSAYSGKSKSVSTDPNDHTFCGISWQDSSDRCSPNTRCNPSAACAGRGEFCFSGILACNASEWTEEPTKMPTRVPTTRPTYRPTDVPTSSPTNGPTDSFRPTQRPTTGRPTISPTMQDRYAVRQSYCASSYSQLIGQCATLQTCNGIGRGRCDGDGYVCYKNVLCIQSTPPPTEHPTAGPTVRPTVEPTIRPTDRPTDRPTNRPTAPTPAPLWMLSSSGSSPSSSSSSSSSNGASTGADPSDRFGRSRNYCASSFYEIDTNCADPALVKTCDDGDPPCPSGTYCFMGVECQDPSAATAPPPPTKQPTTLQPTMRPTTRPTPQPVDYTKLPQPAKSYAQNYCAQSLVQFQRSCGSVAYTCEDGDPPCPVGTYCLNDVVCDDVVEAEEAAVAREEERSAAVFAAAAVAPPARGPAINWSEPQNYCAKTAVQIQETCGYPSAARMCNDGDPPCPSGTFCFGGVVCEAAAATRVQQQQLQQQQSQQQEEEFAPQLPAASPQNYCARDADHLQQTCADPSAIALHTCGSRGSGESACPSGTFCFGNIVCEAAAEQQRSQQQPQNYCARDSDHLQRTCADPSAIALHTCGSGESPCPSGTFCFGNIVCEAAAEQQRSQQQNTQTEADTQQHYQPAAAAHPACDGLCLAPVPKAECAAAFRQATAGTTAMTSRATAGAGVADDPRIPECTSPLVAIGDLCAAPPAAAPSASRCGADPFLDNCPGGLDVYVRLESSACGESGRGVLSPPSSPYEGGGGSVGGDRGGGGGAAGGADLSIGEGGRDGGRDPSAEDPDPNVGGAGGGAAEPGVEGWDASAGTPPPFTESKQEFVGWWLDEMSSAPRTARHRPVLALWFVGAIAAAML